MEKASSGLVSENNFDVVIVGGGLAGLVSSILLANEGYKVIIIEKKKYPFTKVCGEYISNEVLPFLQSLGFDPFDFNAASIKRFRLSTPSGKNFCLPLDLGGFGISRYKMDDELKKLAESKGVIVKDNTKVVEVNFVDDYFQTEDNEKNFYVSKFVIGSYGKRDSLDKKLKRDFIESRTGFMAVKYHLILDYPADEIGLDNFPGGYCGIGKIEDDKYNLCYLYKRNKNFKFNSVKEIEEQQLYKNPNLKSVFQRSTFLVDEPEVINEIYFEKKSQVENHILMCGDAAGLITPLCGNGMSMAIHGAKLLSELLIKSELVKKDVILLGDRNFLEKEYEKRWNQLFAQRLFYGRLIQKMFVSNNLVEAGIRFIHVVPPFEKWLMKHTHGEIIR